MQQSVCRTVNCWYQLTSCLSDIEAHVGHPQCECQLLHAVEAAVRLLNALAGRAGCCGLGICLKLLDKLGSK